MPKKWYQPLGMPQIGNVMGQDSGNTKGIKKVGGQSSMET